MEKNIIEPRTLKGFRDYKPNEQLARQQMFAKIQSVFERFGFLPMSTPVLEYKEILMGKYGDEEKLIYSFKDNGERDVAMRYDLTVPMARFVAQYQNELTFPFKRYQIAPVWRAENTQKGRLREFYQCDIDVVGSTAPVADAEVIACFCFVLDQLGIEDYQVRINDRRIFRLFEGSNTTDIIRAIDKLDKIGKAGVLQELVSKNIDGEILERVAAFLDAALGNPGSLGNTLSEGSLQEVWQDIQTLLTNIKAFGVEWSRLQFNPTIARGLDYYTSTVFEIVLQNNPEFGSIAGGGRYDGLVDTFSTKSLPAVGGSIGIDRLFEALESMSLVRQSAAVQVLVINQSQDLQVDYMNIVARLRRNNISSEMYYEPARLEKQFKYAEGKGVSFVIIFGEDEKAKGVVQVKDMVSRTQDEISLEAIEDYLRKK